MTGKHGVAVLLAGLAVTAADTWAFRSCQQPDSDAWAAATRYVVGEIDFDSETGRAAGTETTYNYANQYGEGVNECHVTYELSGSYVPGVEVFVLDATRTNYSPSCPPREFEIEYPPSRLYAMQMEFGDGGLAVVSSADSGEFLARGTWHEGRAMYKTDETCTIF